MKDIHTTLKDARAIMAERGLAKNKLVTPDGNVCLRGAILIANYGVTWPIMSILCDDDKREILELLVACEEAMGFPPARYGYRLGQAARWNNAPQRTLDEVLACFDKAIEATKPSETEDTQDKGLLEV